MFLLLVIFSFLLTSCSDEKQSKESVVTVPINVEVVRIVKDSTLQNLSSWVGQVQSVQKAEISTRVMGTLVSLNVEEGQQVKKGEVLGKVMSNDLEASRARVEAGILEAETMLNNIAKDVKRIEALFAKGSATQKELDDVKTGYNMTKARLEAAIQAKKEVETQLEYATLVAPFDGFVTHKFLQQGALTSPGMPILTIESGNAYKIIAQVPENEIKLFQVGQQAKVEITAIQKIIDAKVIRLNPSSTFTGTLYEVTLIPENIPTDMKSGMFARINMFTKPQKTTNIDGLWIADSLIVKRGDLTGIYTVSAQSEAILRWIKVGKQQNGYSQILSGLKEGEICIAKAEGELKDGQKVVVKNLN
ncbi:MAG: efflux RND transporter periplasmic adaptor subunit [Flammeovirgaceae bacterium]